MNYKIIRNGNRILMLIEDKPLMNAREYILSKQTQWALNNNIPLIGSKGKRGRLAYTQKIEDNLFEPLSSDVITNFEKGDGNEIHGRPDNPAKMQAIHSSSALSVNIFHYWHTIKQAPVIAAACGFCRKGNDVSEDIVFEDKYQIDESFQLSPNIDVVFHNKNDSKYERFAVECKFSESYGSRHHGGLREKYIEIDSLWKDIPKTYNLAKSISPIDTQFNYLHPAQLIKHILGLKKGFGKTGFRLLYLWYDVLGEEGAAHRKETDAFSKVVKSDDIMFHALSYQELIMKLSSACRADHEAYIKYVSERYL